MPTSVRRRPRCSRRKGSQSSAPPRTALPPSRQSCDCVRPSCCWMCSCRTRTASPWPARARRPAGGAPAVEAVMRLRPAVVLLDVQLPDTDGFAVAGRLAQLAGPPRVVLISSRDAAAYGARIDAAPARGFLAKRELSGAALAALVG